MIWKDFIKQEKEKPYFNKIVEFLKIDALTRQIFPDHKDIFNAFKHCEFDSTKVVIIGMDPYHGEGQAHGLSFSVEDGVKPPPSLVNIFKELKTDLKN